MKDRRQQTLDKVATKYHIASLDAKTAFDMAGLQKKATMFGRTVFAWDDSSSLMRNGNLGWTGPF